MRINIAPVYVEDQDKARAFYVDVLGFQVRHDVPVDGSARWLTLVSPEQPEGPELLLEPTETGQVLDDTCGHYIQLIQPVMTTTMDS